MNSLPLREEVRPLAPVGLLGRKPLDSGAAGGGAEADLHLKRHKHETTQEPTRAKPLSWRSDKPAKLSRGAGAHSRTVL